jgi:hypothetical protein
MGDLDNKGDQGGNCLKVAIVKMAVGKVQRVGQADRVERS